MAILRGGESAETTGAGTVPRVTSVSLTQAQSRGSMQVDRGRWQVEMMSWTNAVLGTRTRSTRAVGRELVLF